MQFHFINDMVEDRKVKMEKVDTLVNVVDALTKPVNIENLMVCLFYEPWGFE